MLSVDGSHEVDDREVARRHGPVFALDPRQRISQALDLLIIASAGTDGSRLPTSRSVYLPNFAFGVTEISIEKLSGCPAGGNSPSSSFGSPTDFTSETRSASSYQTGNESRTACSSTASRPTR